MFVVMAFSSGLVKEQKRLKGFHRTSNEQQGCATILRSVKITVTVSPEPTQTNTVTRIGSYKIEKVSAYTPRNLFQRKSEEERREFPSGQTKAQTNWFWFCGLI